MEIATTAGKLAIARLIVGRKKATRPNGQLGTREPKRVLHKPRQLKTMAEMRGLNSFWVRSPFLKTRRCLTIQMAEPTCKKLHCWLDAFDSLVLECYAFG